MKTITCTFSAAFALAFQLGGAFEQAANLSPTAAASNDVAVKGLPEDKPIVEPHLAAHPRDPNHLVAGAIVADAANPFSVSQVCASLATFDGGRTWSTHVFDIQGCGDPWVAVGSDGDAWFTGLGRRATAAGQRLWLFRSTDGGRTWLDPIDFGTGHDHQTLIVGSPETASENVLYLVSGLGRNTPSARFHAFVARSDDRGKTWREPLVLTPSNLNFNAIAGGLLPDGSLLLPFVDFQKPPFNSSQGMLAQRRVWTYRIQKTSVVSPPLFVSEACAGGHGLGFPSLATVPGSTRAVLVCIGGSDKRVLAQTSDDAIAWTASGVEAGTAASLQRVPSIAASRQGAVAVTWMDSRGMPDGCAQLRAALSQDAGRTFSASRPLSTAPSCSQSEKNGAAGRRWPNGGDYLGLAAGADGAFHALWADSRTGLSQLRFATFRNSDFAR